MSTIFPVSNAVVEINLDDAAIRLRLLELASWASFTQRGNAVFVDSAGVRRTLNVSEIRELVSQVREKQHAPIVVSVTTV
jgi:hypothetical protein